MKLITRDTDYALRALCYIASHQGRVISVTEMSGALRIPKPFLRTLLQRLTRERVVTSYKGRQGGFLLAPRGREVCLADLMEIFQGNTSLNDCRTNKQPCPKIPRCPLHSALESIERDVLKRLKRLTIASLARSFATAGFYGGTR